MSISDAQPRCARISVGGGASAFFCRAGCLAGGTAPVDIDFQIKISERRVA
jgi:hypothetical protein